METLFLNKLYEELWFFPLNKQENGKKWKNQKAIMMEINYLIGRYQTCCKKIKFNNIEKITYSTNINFDTNSVYEKNRNIVTKKRAKKYFIIFSMIYIGIILKIYSLTYIFKDIKFFVILFVLGWCFGIICIINPKMKEAFLRTIIILEFDRASYLLTIKKGKRQCYKNVKEVPLFTFRTSVRFIQTLKSIIAFYLIAPDEKKKNILDALIEQYENGVYELSLPISIIGYFESYDVKGKNKRKSIDTKIHKEDLWVMNNCAVAVCADILSRRGNEL